MFNFTEAILNGVIFRIEMFYGKCVFDYRSIVLVNQTKDAHRPKMWTLGNIIKLIRNPVEWYYVFNALKKYKK